MKALNTEILFEYLVDGNDTTQHADIFFDSAPDSEIYFLNNIVLNEVIKAFEENVKFDKSDVLTALHALVSNSQIRFENRSMVKEAIEMYSESRFKFSECLKTAINSHFHIENTIQSFSNRQKTAVL